MHPASTPKVDISAALRAAFGFLRREGPGLALPGLAAALLAAAAGMFFPLLIGGAPPSFLIAPLTPLYVLLAPLIGAAAAAQGLPSGGPGVGLLALFASIAVAMAHLVVAHRRAGIAAAEPLRAGAMRLFGAFAAVWFVFAILGLGLAIVALTTFAAAIQSLGVERGEIEAMQGDPAAMTALAARALDTPTGGLVWALLILTALAVSWMLARLALFVPATLQEGRILTFRTWAWTGGQGLRIMAAGAIVLAATLVVALIVGAALAALLVGLLGARPGGVSAATLFAMHLAFAAPFAMIVTPAFVGLSAHLYATLRPAAEAPGAPDSR